MPRGKGCEKGTKGKGGKGKGGKGKGGKGKGGKGTATDIDWGAGYSGYYDYSGNENEGYYVMFASNLGMLSNFKHFEQLSQILKNFEQLLPKKVYFLTNKSSLRPNQMRFPWEA